MDVEQTLDHLLIVTGGSSGIGHALVGAALVDGATVANISRTPGGGRHFPADLADPDSWQPTIDWIGEQIASARWNRVSFVHSAATLTPIGFVGEVDLAQYTNNVVLNSASGQVLASAIIGLVEPLGIATNIILVSSGAGKRPISGWSSYCAAKAGLDMWVRTAGQERSARGAPITVVAVGPGIVDTHMQSQIRATNQHAFPEVEAFREMNAAGALASPAQVGAAYWALCKRDDLPQGAVIDIAELSTNDSATLLPRRR